MRSGNRSSVIAALLGYVLLATAHAQSQPAAAWSPMDVPTTAEEKVCVKTLMEAPATGTGSVSFAVGSAFLECMNETVRFHFFVLLVSDRTFYLKCMREITGHRTSGAGGICVQFPESGEPPQARRILIGMTGSATFQVSVDEKDSKDSPPEPATTACKNAYGDPCGTRY